DERCRRAIIVAEDYADGLAGLAQLSEAGAQATEALEEGRLSAESALAAHEYATERLIHGRYGDEDFALSAACDAAYATDDQEAELAAQCELIRDIFGNPFRPVFVLAFWLAWNNGTIPKFAQTIYDELAFDRLPILADALEDA